MCGIAGHVGDSPAAARMVRSMCDSMTHRGPDGEGYFAGGDATIGMRRLAIIDVPGGQQPIYNEQRSVAVVCNGEIYNHVALRRELQERGHRFTTNSDVECIAHLYEEKGDDCVLQLRGMFAFALYDIARQRLLLGRDRVGKKPLYYRAGPSGITFASELKALLRSDGAAHRLDLTAVHHYLTYQYVPAPWSIIEGIEKLAPGHTLSYSHGQWQLRQYWKLDFSPSGPPPDEEEAVERLRELILEAVRIRLMSERPLGAFLSGGVDSSLVVAAMAMQSSGPVRTFSIGFEEEEFDERRFARLVAQRYGTEHQEFVVRAGAPDALKEITRTYDEPFADSSAIPSHHLARLTRESVIVALNGDGGDESFGGYRRYGVALTAERLALPALFRRTGLRLGGSIAARGTDGSVRSRAGRLLKLTSDTPARRYARLMSYFDNEQKSAVYTSAMREATSHIDSYALLERAFDDSTARDPINRMLDVDITTYLPGDLLVKVDTASMAHSLEARSPLLDSVLMEFAATLPASFKIRRGVSKYLLKKAVRPWLPDDVLDRPKMGFGVPLARWLRTDLRELAWDTLTSDTARSRGLFDPPAVSRLLQDHQAGVDHSTRLWALLQFELWAQEHLDRAPAATSPSAIA